MDLHGRAALVTGGAGHIGNAIAEALAELGACVAVVDMAPEACEGACERLQATFGVETLSLPLDLADEPAVRRAVSQAIERFGRLDILVNCAALVGTSELQGWAVPFEQ